MKNIILTLLLLSTLTKIYAQTLTNKQDSIIYCLGLMMANELKGSGITTYNKEVMTSAFDQLLKGEPTIISVDDARNIFSHFRVDVLKEEGEKFLMANSKKPGIVTLPSGLQYQIINAGTGPIPVATNTVTTHYEGSLINGTIFDSSIKRGEPISFPVNGVIKGWQEALQLMPKGSKWKLFIPYQLAYGERGAGGSIPPYSALIFDVELIDFK